MKNSNYEGYSINVLNCLSFKQKQTNQLRTNSLVNQKLKIPLLSLNPQVEQSSGIRPQQFKNVSEEQQFRQKMKTSFESYEKLENNGRQQSIIQQDFSRQKIPQNQQMLQIKPQEIFKFKIEITNKQKKQQMPRDQFKQDFQNIQSLEFNSHRDINALSQLNTKKNTQKIFINSSKHRSYTINDLPGKGNYQIRTINNSKVQTRLVVKKLRLKIIVIIVQCVFRLSKKYKLIFLKRNSAIEYFNMQKKPHINHLKKMPIKDIQQQNKNFVDQIFQKFFKLQNSSNYIREYTEIIKQEKEFIIDFQKQRLCLFIKLILKDLELITRKNIIPGFIHHSLNLCLFRGKNTQSSQFVINRTKFYSKTVHSLTQEQKVLIALEFLIFNIIIPNLLDIANEQVYNNQDHKAITQIYILSIAMLFSQFFTNHFKKLPKIKSSNVKPVQILIKVFEDQEDTPTSAQLIISPNIENDEEIIISGDLKGNFLNKIFSEKPQFQEQMVQIFQKITRNIETLIDIQNFE